MPHATSVTQLMHAFGAGGTNVAEGYPRFAFTPTQRAIVDRLPRMMLDSQSTPFAALEANAQWALLLGLGQRTAPVGTGRIMSYYAAGVAIDLVGRVLAARTGTVGVIHPTLDCLPALIRSRGPRVVPISEARLRRRDPLAGFEAIGGLYIANPNNPSGRVLDPEELRRLAESCARRSVALAIDACFRAFDVEAQYDMYAVLDATGVDYVVIEDTGKLWPLGGVRLAFLAFPEHSALGIPEASGDLLMNAPPFAALVVAGRDPRTTGHEPGDSPPGIGRLVRRARRWSLEGQHVADPHARWHAEHPPLGSAAATRRPRGSRPADLVGSPEGRRALSPDRAGA